MTQIEQLEKLITEAKSEADKFYTKGNSSAGTRLRAIYQEIKATAVAGRTDVQGIKNTERAAKKLAKASK